MDKNYKQKKILEYIADNHKALYGQIYNFFRENNGNKNLSYSKISKELLHSYIDKEVMNANDNKIDKLYSLLLNNKIHGYMYEAFRIIIMSPRSYLNYKKKNEIIFLGGNHNELSNYDQEDNIVDDFKLSNRICLADIETVLYTNKYIHDNEVITGTRNHGIFLKKIFIELLINKKTRKEIIEQYNLQPTTFYEQLKIFKSYLEEVFKKIIEEDDEFMDK